MNYLFAMLIMGAPMGQQGTGFDDNESRMRMVLMDFRYLMEMVPFSCGRAREKLGRANSGLLRFYSILKRDPQFLGTKS